MSENKNRLINEATFCLKAMMGEELSPDDPVAQLDAFIASQRLVKDPELISMVEAIGMEIILEHNIAQAIIRSGGKPTIEQLVVFNNRGFELGMPSIFPPSFDPDLNTSGI